MSIIRKLSGTLQSGEAIGTNEGVLNLISDQGNGVWGTNKGIKRILGGDSFSPSDRGAELDTWLDSSDSSTILVTAGTSVDEWQDKSGNGNDFTQSVGANKPVYTSVTSGLQFDGANDSLLSSGYALSGDLTIYVVMKTTGVTPLSGVYPIIGTASTGGGVPGWMLLGANAFVDPNEYRMSFEPFFGGAGIEPTALKRYLDMVEDERLYTYDTDLVLTTRIEGASVGASGDTAIGAFPNGVFYANQVIYEIVITNTADTLEQITEMNSYLSSKWGTP